MSKDQQPTDSKQGASGKNSYEMEGEHFVVKPDDPNDKRASAASDEELNAQAYEPPQFDLDDLPDEPAAKAEDTAVPPLGFVSEPRPSRKKPLQRPSRKPEPAPADVNEIPPLGFVSEPRPAGDEAGGQPPPLGFVSEPRPAKPKSAKAENKAPAKSANESMVAQAEEVMDPEALTPGQMLQKARKRRGLSIDDVVESTRMNADTIQALEEDRDPEQSAWVYVRGFYRRYAKALSIPEEPLLDAHARLHGDAKPTAQPVADEWAPQDVSASPSLWPKMIFVLIAGICLGTAVFFLQPKLTGYVEKADIKQKASTAYGGIKNAAVVAKDKSVAVMGTAAETVKTQSAEFAEVANQQYAKAAEKVKSEATPILEAARAQRESMQKATGEGEASKEASKPEPVATSEQNAVASQEPTQTAQAEPERVEDAPATDTAASTESPAPAEQAMLQPETTGPTETSETPETAQPASTASADTAAASSAVLEMQFSRQTWLSVTDGNGVVLFEDMIEGETQKRFEAEPPIILFLGTATAADAWFDGQPVNIASQMRSNGTARLVLGEQPQ